MSRLQTNRRSITAWGQTLHNSLGFTYDEDGEVVLSPFASAFRLGWYDEDFAEIHFGRLARELLLEAAETWHTLDEQALPRFPAGEWNGLYIVTGGAGEEWSAPNARPPMPHGEVRRGDGVQARGHPSRPLPPGITKPPTSRLGA
ncbi:immunity 22 family protein [Deinococcus aestuarii]|uniref:immunity 22 family protein n=1 Tax=Deinococcus aestuarii TaxID=2774531 RepID=UPI001C0DF7E3